MDLTLTEEQDMLRDGARRLLAAEYSFAQRRAMLTDPQAAAALWQRFAEMGWLSIGFTEAQGGLGGSAADVAVLMEEFGRALVAAPYISCVVLAGSLLATAGHDALAPIMAGETQAALAHDEPGRRLQTTAEKDGAAYRLRGRKLLALGAPLAGVLVVSACFAGAGTALFLVKPDAPGLTMRRYRTVDGFAAADLALDGVTATPLILDGADAALSAAQDAAIVAAGAEALGICQAVIAMTRDYAQTRKQFGRAIGEFQVVQHRLADMFVETERLRGALYGALAAAEGTPRERMQTASALKVQIGAAAQFVTAQGIQLHGGMGVTDETAVGHYFKRITVLESLWGNSAFHLDRYARLMAAA
jgi:alkylation response protein AidB-like acyl-CoA dehydrogenase